MIDWVNWGVIIVVIITTITTIVELRHLIFFQTILLYQVGNLHVFPTTCIYNAYGNDVHTILKQEHTHLQQICILDKAFRRDSYKLHNEDQRYPNSKLPQQTNDQFELSLLLIINFKVIC